MFRSTPSLPPSSGIQVWVLMLKAATSLLQSYWAKGRMRHKRNMWVNPGSTWETLSKNHWITEYFKIKARNGLSPRSRCSSHTLYVRKRTVPFMHSWDTIVPAHPTVTYLQSGPLCTYMSYRCTGNLDHITPVCCVLSSVIQTTFSLHTASLQPQFKLTPTCMFHRRTCNLDLIPPIHRAVASAIRTACHLSDGLSNRQSGPRPSAAIRHHICSSA